MANKFRLFLNLSAEIENFELNLSKGFTWTMPPISILLSHVVSSKQPKLGLTQEFSRISESITGYQFTPCVGSFTPNGIGTR